MFEKILMPLDGSEIAELALPYGEELARRLGAEVILTHVHGPEQQAYEHMHRMYLDRLAETVKHNIRKGRSLKGTDVQVTARVETGEPIANICKLVEQNDIGLIIMTAVSASGVKIGKMLGSVADQVCRTVPIPVMLIRPKAAKMPEDNKRLINRILLPVDGSDLSRLALPVGEELADKLKVSINLFQMSAMMRPLVDETGTGGYYMDFTKINQEMEKRVRADVIKLEQEIRDKSLTVTHSVVTGFDAADEIITACKKVDADLVVMSTHGRSGIQRWVFGGVAEKVLRHGETPLLLVNARAS